MKSTDFNWHGGEVTFWDLDCLSDRTPIADQIDSLKEDLAQVAYSSNNCVLDIGWYPEFSLTGHFTVYVIKDSDWQHPIYSCKCNTFSELRIAIANAVNVVLNYR